MIIDGNKISSIFSGLGFNPSCPHLIVLDAKYAVLDDSKASDFFKSLSNQVISLFGSWESEKRDCDKYARCVQGLALAAHAMQSKSNVGLGFATICYMKDGEGGHAVNAMITNIPNTSQLKIRVFEPQTGYELFLSKAEKKSLFAVLL